MSDDYGPDSMLGRVQRWLAVLRANDADPYLGGWLSLSHAAHMGDIETSELMEVLEFAEQELLRD